MPKNNEKQTNKQTKKKKKKKKNKHKKTTTTNTPYNTAYHTLKHGPGLGKNSLSSSATTERNAHAPTVSLDPSHAHGEI